MSGYHVDTLNLSQGHQGRPEDQGCLTISITCMSLLHTSLRDSTLQLNSRPEACMFLMYSLWNKLTYYQTPTVLVFNGATSSIMNKIPFFFYSSNFQHFMLDRHFYVCSRWVDEVTQADVMFVIRSRFLMGTHSATSGIPGGYRLVSTYDLPHFPKWGAVFRSKLWSSQIWSFPEWEGVFWCNVLKLPPVLPWRGPFLTVQNYPTLKFKGQRPLSLPHSP